MRFFRHKPKQEVFKVWIEIMGMPFYVPVTDPYVELCHGRKEAERLLSEWKRHLEEGE